MKTPNAKTPTLRPANDGDVAAIVGFNAEAAEMTSPMSAERFRMLRGIGAQVVAAEMDNALVGFLMGFCDRRPYDGVNYQWFAARLKEFFYIDRVVVDAAHRGGGIGAALYKRIAKTATDSGALWLAADINLSPPNEGSLRFHRRHNFVQAGEQTLPSGKIVSLQIRAL